MWLLLLLQVGGYTEGYNNGNFNFVTVRNAGHMVPYMQPARAFAVFKAFLHQQDMPRRTAPVASQLRLAKQNAEAQLPLLPI